MDGTRAAVAPVPVGERIARAAQSTLRILADARLGGGVLLVVAALNLAAALLAPAATLLAGPLYAALLGVVVLTGVAAMAVRAPAAWREWRQPVAVRRGAGAVSATLPALERDQVAARLAGAGYRIREEPLRGGWAVHGVRRGWSRFAAVASHLTVSLIVLGAAMGGAFGSETVFSLLPGDQALLDTPRPGFASAVRLERFDADFGPDDRPRRLDAHVTFLRDGEPVRSATLRVNEPGDFDGYLVHPWTYGPAARLRVTALDGAPLLDAAVALDKEQGGVPVGSVELPTGSVTLGLALSDAAGDELGVSVVGRDGLVDAVRVRPGDARRVSDLTVRLDGYSSWVTLMSRRDPGLAVLFAGAGLLCASLAVAFWLPRRRLTARLVAGQMELLVRGERFDRPSAELERLRRVLAPSG